MTDDDPYQAYAAARQAITDALADYRATLDLSRFAFTELPDEITQVSVVR